MGFSNILATTEDVVVYNGKVVTKEFGGATCYCKINESGAEYIVNNNIPFGTYAQSPSMGTNFNKLAFEDSTPVVEGRDTIDISQVPSDLTFRYFLEPQFVILP